MEGKTGQMQDYMSISELIRLVQKELINSQNERLKKKQPVLFKTSELQIELNTVVTQNAERTCTLGIPILNGELNIGDNSQTSQKITLKLKVEDLNFLSSEETEEERFLPPEDNARISGRYPQIEDLE